MADKNSKKQIPLRLSDSLYAELNRWAEEDFRSLNGQIEYLLTEAVRSRRKKSFTEDSSEETNN
ncbi:MAG: Arc family DNA-binding protein [Sphaerochaetaceae bacterium]|nr:Arc family DNA-binding protein [Sphaerochaetaceae bacterium]